MSSTEDSLKDAVEDQFFIPGFKDPASFSQETLRSVLTATKAANDLPSSGDDFDFYSSFAGFRNVMLQKRQSILSLMTSLIQNQGVRESFQRRELDEKFDLLIDVNDVILENVSNYIDEATGVKKSNEELVLAVKPPNAINTSWNKKQFSSNPQSYKLLTAKNISRPQLTFKDKIDNTDSAFVPIIKEKPNSIKPLAIILEKGEDRDEYCHPYEWEIEKFKPEEEHLQETELVFPKPLDETLFVFVDTEEELQKLLDTLKKEKEIAVDLEHHSYRSFQGFSCLMQISTNDADYIVDVLKLRNELHVLNEVFTDPKIVKVLHGADMDILWLQRDFGLYIVNLFDTGQAARVLHFAHLSLSYLLKHYCKINLDKKFQLADWRIRPLPAEMMKYAREDTHYLLYVYKCLKNDLLKHGNEMKNLLLSTFDRSKLICLKKYQKPVFSEDKYLDLYKKSHKKLNAKQLYCLKELYSWRNKTARENDESVQYVLPNHMLLQIAEALPREQQGILACCNPVPPLVKQQLNLLHSIVLKANESSVKQLETLELEQKSQVPKVINQIDLSNLIHCPHDILHLEDRKEQLTESSASENVLPHISKSLSSSSLLKKKPILSALFQKSRKKAETASLSQQKIPQKVIEQIKKLISPYERYKLTEELQSHETKKSKSRPVQDHTQESQESIQESIVDDSSRIVDNSVTELAEGHNSEPEDLAETVEDILESTPLRKKGKKKKRKQKAEPDISLIVSSEPLSKKQKTPEVVTIDDDSFTPYDYSQSSYCEILGNQSSNDESRKNKNQNYQTPRPHFGKKRRHAKQTTYNKNSANNSGPSSKWPKNK